MGILQLIHWATMPVVASMALPRGWAVLFSFCSIFVLWCIHFNALDLEFPFGNRVNDLPMNEFMQDWNRSIITLLDKKATRPPVFKYDPTTHNAVDIVMSDASDLYVPKWSPPMDKGIAVIKVSDKRTPKRRNPSTRLSEVVLEAADRVRGGKDISGSMENGPIVLASGKPPGKDPDPVKDAKDPPVKDPPVPSGAKTNSVAQASLPTSKEVPPAGNTGAGSPKT